MKITIKATWNQIGDNIWFYHAPGYAVFGSIDVKDDSMFYWSARVMDDCRVNCHPITGKAHSLDKAKRIVETLCIETDTLSRNNVKS